MAAPFVWGSAGQKITGPEQAKRARDIAYALKNRPAADSWQSGLANLTNGFAGMKQENDIAAQEAAGRERAGGLFADLAVNQDPNAIIAALTSPDAAWASPAQTDIASALLNSGLERQDPMYQAQLAKLQAEAAAGPKGENFFGTGIPIDNGDGTISYGQFGNQGGFNIPELPEGASFLTPVQQLNTGTGFTGVDKFGNQTGTVTPIDNFTPAQDAAIGTAIGGAAAARILELPATIATTDNMVSSIDGILNDPALDASTGWLSWMQGVPGTDQYRFGQRALQLQGQAFLQAFDSLKGAGQITEVEGSKATQAIGRLSTAQNSADYRDALSELKGVISAAKQRAINSAGQVQLPSSSAIGGASQPSSGADVIDWNDL